MRENVVLSSTAQNLAGYWVAVFVSYGGLPAVSN
jgi:hypothetical protein